MSPRQNQQLTTIHQWATVTVIPAMLGLILYFLMDVHKQVKTASNAVIKHEEQIHDHERSIEQLEQYVFRTR